jgi:hypothetical protein
VTLAAAAPEAGRAPAPGPVPAPRRRRWPWLAAAAAAALLLPVVIISPVLSCAGARVETSPDGAHGLCFARVPLPFAMPGQGGDAGGFAVLRDRAGWIEGVVAIDMLAAIDRPAQWSGATVAIPLALELALPAAGRSRAARALADLSWRMRAALRLVPHDDDFR